MECIFIFTIYTRKGIRISGRPSLEGVNQPEKFDPKLNPYREMTRGSVARVYVPLYNRAASASEPSEF